MVETGTFDEGWSERDYRRRFERTARQSMPSGWARLLAKYGTLYSDEKLEVFTEQVRAAVARHIGYAPHIRESAPRGPIEALPTDPPIVKDKGKDLVQPSERQFFLAIDAFERSRIEADLNARVSRLELYAIEELRLLRALAIQEDE